MSTTILEKTVGFPVTVEIVSCKEGGYAWVVKDLHLVGQADTEEEIQAMVSEDVTILCKSLMSRLDLESENR